MAHRTASAVPWPVISIGAGRKNPDITKESRNLLADLRDDDRHLRMRAAAYLGDSLAASAEANKDVRLVVTALMDALLAEDDPGVQEEIAHSLGYLAEYGQAGRATWRQSLASPPNLAGTRQQANRGEANLFR
jgi:hypothetical protein